MQLSCICPLDFSFSHCAFQSISLALSWPQTKPTLLARAWLKKKKPNVLFALLKVFFLMYILSYLCK